VTHEESVALNQAVGMVMQEGIVAFVGLKDEKLRRAAEAEAKYLSFLSHDLRNNLNSAMLTMNLLRGKLQALPEFREDVEAITAAQRSIRETISGMERLLHAERARKVTSAPQPAPVRLRELLSELVTAFLPQAREKQQQLTSAVPDDAVVVSDKELIKLVLQNLLGNALKYGGDTGEVRIDARANADERWPGWTLSVSDQGPGIAAEDRHRLFDAFVRGETHGREGVGLGLAIADQAAKALGGRLSVQSEPGKGATFSLTLPQDVKAAQLKAGPRAPYV
jgi:signal transduction histidine kinase